MSGLPKLSPMPLIQVSAPFDDPDFLYEVKFDGFRALAYVDDGYCELVSRKGHVYRRFADLRESIAADLKVHNCILDGELVCLDDQGRSQFHDLMFNRGKPYFYAFDLLYVDGADLRDLPLVGGSEAILTPRGDPLAAPASACGQSRALQRTPRFGFLRSGRSPRAPRLASPREYRQCPGPHRTAEQV